MARTYSDRFLLKLNRTTGDDVSPGVRLAKLCVEAKLPLAYVAEHLGVTKLSVHSWFRGKGIQKNREPSVVQLCDTLQRDLAAAVLPVKNNAHAKVYLKDLRR